MTVRASVNDVIDQTFADAMGIGDGLVSHATGVLAPDITDLFIGQVVPDARSLRNASVSGQVGDVRGSAVQASRDGRTGFSSRASVPSLLDLSRRQLSSGRAHGDRRNIGDVTPGVSLDGQPQSRRGDAEFDRHGLVGFSVRVAESDVSYEVLGHNGDGVALSALVGALASSPLVHVHDVVGLGSVSDVAGTAAGRIVTGVSGDDWHGSARQVEGDTLRGSGASDPGVGVDEAELPVLGVPLFASACGPLPARGLVLNDVDLAPESPIRPGDEGRVPQRFDDFPVNVLHAEDHSACFNTASTFVDACDHGMTFNFKGLPDGTHATRGMMPLTWEDE